MQEPFDWEMKMEATRRSAQAASQNSENTIAGISKLLREIDRNSNKLVSLTKTIDQMAATQQQQLAQAEAALDCKEGNAPHSWRLPALGLLAIFAVGVIFGGYFVS